MAERIIVWTETAKKQRREILKYWTIRNQSPKYSHQLITQIADRIKVILNQPEIYKKADFPNTRVAAMEHYSIFYKITGSKLIITAFWDNRQNPEKLYELLK